MSCLFFNVCLSFEQGECFFGVAVALSDQEEASTQLIFARPDSADSHGQFFLQTML